MVRAVMVVPETEQTAVVDDEKETAPPGAVAERTEGVPPKVILESEAKVIVCAFAYVKALVRAKVP
jgi:hypothetical protein